MSRERAPLGLRAERELDEKLVAWYTAPDHPERRGGDVNRALAIGMVVGRLAGSYTPPARLLQVNLAWRERLVAEMRGRPSARTGQPAERST